MKKKLKIGLLIKDLYGGGAERAISRLSYILDEEFDVYMILFNSDKIDYSFKGKLIALNIPLRNGVLGKIIVSIKRILALRSIKKELDLNVTISYLENANIANLLTLTNDKKIISVRNYKGAESKVNNIHKMKNFMMKFLYKYADYVVAVSDEIKIELIDKYKINSQKIKVIYNCYDVDEIKKMSEENLNVNELKYFNTENIVTTVGRVSYQKGFWNLLKVINIVKETIPDIKLLIIGHPSDKEMYKNLIKMININDMKKNIEFTGKKENPFKLISKSKLYILSSLFEGFPNAMVEAMACAVPVLATDCKSGPKEILFENYDIDLSIAKSLEVDYGILTPCFKNEVDFDLTKVDREHYEMAKGIINTLNSKKTMAKYKSLSEKRARDFDYETCKEKYTELIRGEKV